MSRPKKNPADVKGVVVQLRVTPAMREELQLWADQEHEPVSSILRRAVLQYLRDRGWVDPDAPQTTSRAAEEQGKYQNRRADEE